MYFAIIDCGTTNSRIYVVNEKREIVGKSAKKVGVGNVAVQGSNRILKEGLKETFLEAVQNGSLTLEDIHFAISSGVITSEIGLLEIPHLLAPVSIDELAQNVKKIRDVAIFPLDIPVVFVRGIKTTGDIEISNLMNAGKVDFMRGEETQVAGLLSAHNHDLPLTIIFLTSHTKYVSINAKGEIAGSITTLSGQMYEAVIGGTVISKSIRRTDNFDDSGYFDTKIIENACYWVKEGGFLRTLLMPRLADVLLKTKWYERKLFLEAAIAAEDMHAMNQFERFGFPEDTDFVIIGENDKRCKIHKYLLQRMKLKGSSEIISDAKSIDMLTINGAIEIAKRGQLLKG